MVDDATLVEVVVVAVVVIIVFSTDDDALEVSITVLAVDGPMDIIWYQMHNKGNFCALWQSIH